MIGQAPSLPPLPPPPPPPPALPRHLKSYDRDRVDASSEGLDLVGNNIFKPNMKMRSLNWRRVPKRKVLYQQVDSALENKQYKLCSSASQEKEANVPINAREEVTDRDENKNIWFLIAKANKSIKKVNTCGKIDSSRTSPSSLNRSASRIRDMLESVRRRMIAISNNSLDSISQSSEFMTCKQQERFNSILETVDFEELENLFCLNNQPTSEQPSDATSYNLIQSHNMRYSSDSMMSQNSYSIESSNTGEDDDLSHEVENILDSKRSLNVNIFLKQIKSQRQLIEQIIRGDYSAIGKERLENLLKLLPTEIETEHLIKFQTRNRQHRLPVAERFLLQLLTDIDNLELRIKFMLLQEVYKTDLKAVEPEIDKIEAAASEIQASRMFRDILNLVLITGNFLNAGGYAADAAGFTLDCLERLNDVRSNKPGVNLMHYLAEMADKLKLSDFIQVEMQHLECASRVCVDSIRLDLKMILEQINDLKSQAERDAEIWPKTGKKDDQLFLLNLLRTLEDIGSKVDLLHKRATLNLEALRKQLGDYLCEDVSTFQLHQCFSNILTFGRRLKTSSEENERRQRLASVESERPISALRRSNTINPRIGKSLNNLSHRRQSATSLIPTSSFSKRASLGFTGPPYKPSKLSRTLSTASVYDRSAFL